MTASPSVTSRHAVSDHTSGTAVSYTPENSHGDPPNNSHGDPPNNSHGDPPEDSRGNSPKHSRGIVTDAVVER